MTTTHKKLGIIAGGGGIPRKLIERCLAEKRDFFVLAIEGNADKNLITDDVPHKWIRIGQAGTGFKKLHEEKVAPQLVASITAIPPVRRYLTLEFSIP